MGLLELRVARVPNVVGIYGASGNLFPVRMSYLLPEAAQAYVAAAKALQLRVSDMFRTAEESMRARAEKQGVQPPGYSAHNYGLAIDVAVDDVLAANKFSKADLDRQMISFGWYCHRKDSKRGMEDWHYNYLGNRDQALEFLTACEKSTNRADAVEAKIEKTFGDQLLLTPEEAQLALAKMKLYSGVIDGIFGGGSKQALLAFQRAWRIAPSGVLCSKTERTLAYVTADVVEVSLAVS